MRLFFARMSICAAGLAPALLALLSVSLSADVAFSDSLQSVALAPATASAPSCASDVVVYQPNPSPDSEPDCAAYPRTPTEIAEARGYVIETARPGYTMTLQGLELAIGRLHPEFVVRLANAIREARNDGLSFAGVFSAYRPPAFGIGGFSDKFNSLHTYGLAVDMHGIGRPGSPEAQLWHEIAAKNGVVCPYGPRDRAEWNHCQPTSVKIILAENPLRETVSADGPLSLESMFEVGNAVIESMASAADSLARAVPTPVSAPEAAAKSIQPKPEAVANFRTKRVSRFAARRIAIKSARAVPTPVSAPEAAAKSIQPKPEAVANVRTKRVSRLAARRVAIKSARAVPTPVSAPEAAAKRGRVAIKSIPRAREKLGARVAIGKTPIIAVEEGRRKSKSRPG
jgi:hypothetical protein